jgi:hypothetical protein
MNPEDSKQFDDIMGRNFPKQTVTKMTNRATEGAAKDIQGDRVYNNVDSGLARMSDFPQHMITSDENGEYRVQYRSPKGWTHTWNGGPYIEHGNAKTGPIDVTNMHDYSLASDQQPYRKGITHATFMEHVNNFEKYADENYPKDYRP